MDDSKIDRICRYVYENKAYKIAANNKMEPIPDAGRHDRAGQAEIIESIKEHAAESDEELMEKFFAGEDFTAEEMARGLAESVKAGSIRPVFCGSGTANWGIGFIMDSIVKFMPAANTEPSVAAQSVDGNDVTLKASDTESLSAIVFKNDCRSFCRQDFHLPGILRTDEGKHDRF